MKSYKTFIFVILQQYYTTYKCKLTLFLAYLDQLFQIELCARHCCHCYHFVRDWSRTSLSNRPPSHSKTSHLTIQTLPCFHQELILHLIAFSHPYCKDFARKAEILCADCEQFRNKMAAVSTKDAMWHDFLKAT